MDNTKDKKPIVFDGEYESLLAALKKKYNDKLKETADKYNAEYRGHVVEALGEEFRSLVHERVLLLKNLKIYAERLSKDCGISASNAKYLSLKDWISENDRDQKKGEKLILELIEEASSSNSEYAGQIKHISRSLAQNRDQIDQIFKSRGDVIKVHENEIKSEMKKIVLKLMLEYNLELKILRKQFDLPSKGLENPFTDHAQAKADKKDLIEELSTDDKYTFIDVKDDKNDLN